MAEHERFIRTIVYSCSAAKLGEIAGGSFVVPCRDLLAYGNPSVTVIGPILEEDGVAVHQGFWS